MQPLNKDGSRGKDGNPKGWDSANASYDVYYEGERITCKGVPENVTILNGKILKIAPISNPISVSRDVCYLIHKESTKLVFAPPALMNDNAKLLNAGDFTFRVKRWDDEKYDRHNIRLDIMWGIKVIRPELIIKIIL